MHVCAGYLTPTVLLCTGIESPCLLCKILCPLYTKHGCTNCLALYPPFPLRQKTRCCKWSCHLKSSTTERHSISTLDSGGLQKKQPSQNPCIPPRLHNFPLVPWVAMAALRWQRKHAQVTQRCGRG